MLVKYNYPMRAAKAAILLVKTPEINIVLVHLWYSPVKIWYSPVNTSFHRWIRVFTGEYQFLQVNTSFHRWIPVFGIFMVFTNFFSINSYTTDFPHRIKSSQWVFQVNTRKFSPQQGSGCRYSPQPVASVNTSTQTLVFGENFLVFTCNTHCNW